jgi:hypothetical protein
MGRSLAPRRDSLCQVSLWNRKESGTRKQLSEKEKKRYRRVGDGALNYLVLPFDRCSEANCNFSRGLKLPCGKKSTVIQDQDPSRTNDECPMIINPECHESPVTAGD